MRQYLKLNAERGGTHHVIGHVTLHTSENPCARSGSGGPGASHHNINMEFAPLLSINAAVPALPEALGFLLITRLLLILKGYI